MDYTICVAKTKALISCAVTVKLISSLLSHMQNTCFLMMRLNIWCKNKLNIWCKNKFYLVKVLKGFYCVWWFIRVVLHVGSVCQSDIRLSDCLDLFRRPAPAITRVEILYEVDLFNKLTSRFVSLKNK